MESYRLAAVGADGGRLLAVHRLLLVTKMMCLTRIALQTGFGPAALDPFALLAVVHGADNAFIRACLVLRLLGLDI